MNTFKVETSGLYEVVKSIKDNGCAFQYFEDTDYNGRSIIINQKELIHFANCSYLGLEKHPNLINGSINAVKKHGTQNSMSRAILSSPLYKELELLLSKMFPGNCILYPTTTLSHCSALPILINEKDAIILDAYVHNSVRMASNLCKANGTFVLVSKHNDMEHVKYLIKRLKKDGYEKIWYCADGIYSMHGDLCDVKGLHKLLDEENDFYAYIDDAHGIGWTGKNGCGYVIGLFGLHKKMIVVGSLAKSMAVNGGILIVPDESLADIIRLTGQTTIFSGPIQPASLGALIESVKLHLSKEIELYQKELVDLIIFFRKKSHELGIPLSSNDITPIQLIKIGTTEKVLLFQRRLIEKGFFTSTAVYPAVPKGEEGLRISLTRHIKKEDIEKLLLNLKDVLEDKRINNISFLPQ